MNTCKDCGAEVSKSAKTCPKCGAKLKGGKGKIVLIVIVVIILLGAIAGMGDSESSSSSSSSSTSSTTETTKTEEAVQEPDPYENDQAYIASNKKFATETEASMVVEYGYPTITGSLKNLSGKDFSYVDITFSLYDSDGAQIGSAYANINNLGAEAIWKYEAIGFEENAASFKLVEITAF